MPDNKHVKKIQSKEGDVLCLDNEIWSVRENIDKPILTDVGNILKDI